MRITNNLPTRILCRTLALVLANAAIPFGIPKMIIDAWPKSAPKPIKKALKPSRPLTAKQMKTMQGKSGANPYLAGQSKWDPTFKGVDLLTGNYSMSVTDLDFEGGYGIPVNVTRSYSANCADEGPFGYGWTLSADVRSTAGGLLKGPNSPVRSIPGNMTEQPPMEYDPNSTSGNGQQANTGSGGAVAVVPNQPVQAVTATDAGGTAETIQKDVDGVLTTPPWDNNVHNAVYEFVTLGGNVYQVMLSNTTTTIDGTTYVYACEGSYPSGTLPYNYQYQTTTPTATPANILKVTSATDRQGNVTNYSYGGTAVTFIKSDGTTSELPLTSVSMPNGHVITFTWGNGTTAPTNRIYQVNDGPTSTPGSRTVTYGYDDSSELTSVTTPGGKTTSYTYAEAQMPTGWTDSYPVSPNVLSSITDPRGLTTHIYYQMGFPTLMPYGVSLVGVMAYRIDDPNGVRTYIATDTNNFPLAANGFGADDTPVGSSAYADFITAGGGSIGSMFVQIKDWGSLGSIPAGSVCGLGTLINSGAVYAGTSGSGSSTAMTVQMFDGAQASWLIPSGTSGLRYTKVYNVPNQTLTSDDERTNSQAFNPALFNGSTYFFNPHGLPAPAWASQDVTTTKQYNFMGNPISSVVTESQTTSGTTTTTRTAETDYAYWGASKYYQQKATKDQAGRYTYTDYYPNTASPGSLGQTYEVFTGAYTTFDNTASGDTNWRSDLVVDSSSAGTYSAQFVYDSVGRATDVYKLQNTSGTWAYVQTHTTYSADNSPAWGEAHTVTEDYGGIGRTTTTNGYTPDGKADDVTDAASHRFVTSYDLDGVVQNVALYGSSSYLVSYAYGSSGLTNGMPVTITDGLSGVVQHLNYASSGGGVGQVSSVVEDNGSDEYSSLYSYDDAGNRATVEYSTPSATNYWRYDDYNRMGTADNPKYAFQTLTKSNSSYGETAEAMHYLYDSQGRLEDAAFAQTPAAGFTPSGSNPWYDSGDQASSRARAFYTYDPAGRVLSIDHWWDTWGGSSYTSTYLVGNACTYEIGTGDNRGLKTGDTFLTDSSSSPATAWTQSYGYDANFDYLTSASYGDGQPNSSQSWTYDAAGNRTSDYTGSGWTYDNLNRMTASPGMTYTNDILGNRTAKTPTPSGSVTGYTTWDCLNRMLTSTQPVVSTGGLTGASTASMSYEYRADGMRVEKILHSGEFELGVGEIDDQYSRYRYDGQMPMETYVIKADSSTVLTENGLGARGLDYVSLTSTPSGGSPTTSVMFPIYDAHGNEVATLSRSGSSYSLGNQRSYGAWGEIRQGATTGGPRGRYCASLGHVEDDETGLVYMRARYYESTSGRFISEDPQRSGSNLTLYCNDDPVQGVDASGKDVITPLQFAAWIASIEQCCLESPQGKTVLSAYEIMWAAWASADCAQAASGNWIGTAGALQKLDFAIDAGVTIMATPSQCLGIAQAAVGEEDAYTLGLTITMWMLTEDD